MAELTVLSYGGGQDSTAILLKLIHDNEFRIKYAPNRLLVIISDTGDEHKETYEYIEYIKRMCEKVEIDFVHLTTDYGFHYDNWQSLRGFYNLKKTVGSKAFPKTCTDKLKIQPIYMFLDVWVGLNYYFDYGRKKALKSFAERFGKVDVLIGIAKGEERRIADPSKEPVWKQKSIRIVYPLIELGMDRRACQDYTMAVGEPVPLPSNCVLCPFMSKIELLWLYRFLPDDYYDWVRIEQNKIEANKHMGDRNLGVWGKKLLPQVLKEAKQEHDHMTDDELQEYKMSHGHCVMSKY
jgi:hypothetical protein